MTYRLHPEATLRAVGKAVGAPRQFKIVRSPDIRKISLQGFKFWVIYREVDDAVQVLAVAHHRRHPDYWMPRA